MRTEPAAGTTLRERVARRDLAPTRPILLVGGLAATVIVVAGLRAMGEVVAPVFLALVATVTAYPVRSWFQRRGLPGLLGSLVALLAIYAALLGLTAALVVAGAQLAALLPAYQDEFNQLVREVVAALQDLGVGPEQLEQIRSGFDLGAVVGLAGDLLLGAAGVAGDLFFLVTVVFFMVFDAGRFAVHLGAIPSSGRQLGQALSGFARSTRTYVVVSTVFGLIVAVLDILALLWIGVPGVLLWGLLSFVTNYIPNIGFVIGVVPPALLGLLEGGWPTLIAVLVAYSVINVVIQTLIQPRFVGDAVGLSPTVTMLSLVFWAWTLGAMGALLAVPLTLFARALLLDSDPRLAWVVPLVSGRSAHERREGRET